MVQEIDRVIFVPVIHTDPESVETARRKVLESKPDVVAVELDRLRYHQLTNPEEYEDMSSGSQTDFGVNDLMNQIALLEKNLGQETGAMAGTEMMAAIEAGREIGAKIALIDRPMQVTAQALAQVPLDEIYRLSNLIPEANEDISDGEAGNLMDFLKEDGAVDNLLSEFKKEFPVLASVLIDQRDAFIANAIMSILNDVEGKIVAVLGAGHIEGVTNTLKDMMQTDAAG
ncbi:MAG: TraB/GumN family protein [Candidatus Thorarchaeota archaeon]|jgi:pheromone shutdown protein TraB